MMSCENLNAKWSHTVDRKKVQEKGGGRYRSLIVCKISSWKGGKRESIAYNYGIFVDLLLKIHYGVYYY